MTRRGTMARLAAVGLLSTIVLALLAMVGPSAATAKHGRPASLPTPSPPVAPGTPPAAVGRPVGTPHRSAPGWSATKPGQGRAAWPAPEMLRTHTGPAACERGVTLSYVGGVSYRMCWAPECEIIVRLQQPPTIHCGSLHWDPPVRAAPELSIRYDAEAPYCLGGDIVTGNAPGPDDGHCTRRDNCEAVYRFATDPFALAISPLDGVACGFRLTQRPFPRPAIDVPPVRAPVSPSVRGVRFEYLPTVTAAPPSSAAFRYPPPGGRGEDVPELGLPPARSRTAPFPTVLLVVSGAMAAAGVACGVRLGRRRRGAHAR